MSKDVEISRVSVTKFKRIDSLVADISGLNVLVGGNNSGKSSFLQAIHFGVIAAVAARNFGRNTFTQDALLYCPSKDFTDLRHGGPYYNQSNFGTLVFDAKHQPEDEAVKYSIRVYRGRNEGNVGCTREGDRKLGQLVTDDVRPFSVYVPGLAGIPRTEEYKSEGVIRRGVAGGDANLYLRNVLLLIKSKDLSTRLSERMKRVFPNFWMEVNFDHRSDVDISVRVSTTGPNGRKCPLELTGTGVLQALQIFSYITLFEPTLLLLDEPDAHLHPNNQGLLARALIAAADDSETQIICSTHSRHIVEALYDDAQFIWLQAGAVLEQGKHLAKVPLLLDLGAIDSLDGVQNGEIDWFVLTEDSDVRYIRTMLDRAGFNLDRTEIRSYMSSSRLEAAIELARYLHDVSPATKVIIHRDRDFMTDEEVGWTSAKITAANALPYITVGCDMESSFASAAHLAALLGVDEQEVVQWLDELALAHHIKLQHSFTRKRDEIKNSLYRNRVEAPPDTLMLMGGALPLSSDKRLGKDVLKLCNGSAHARFNRSLDANQITDFLDANALMQIRVG